MSSFTPASFPIERLRKIAPALRMMQRFPSRPAKEISTDLGIERSEIAAWVECNRNKRPSHADIEAMEVRLADGDAPEAEPAAVKPPPIAAPAAPVISPVVKAPVTPAPVAVNAGGTEDRTVPPAQPLKLMATSNVAEWLGQWPIKILGRVMCFQVEVTPQIAADWLRLNSINRKPSRAKIKRFKGGMKEGRWVLNGETVKFSVSGRLLDGQSRLQAVIDSGAAIPLEVRAGLPDRAQETMDTGELRKSSHTLEMLGERNANNLAAAIKLVWLLEQGCLFAKKFGESAVMENYEVGPILERHAELRASVGWALVHQSAIKLLAPNSEIAFFHYTLTRIDQELAEHFFDALIDGTGLTKQSPVYHLRTWLLTARADRGDAHASKKIRRALIVKAWNACRDGGACSGLRFADDEAFPTIDGYVPPASASAA